ncbi:MAG: lipoyl(octanoyl) transferase LipB [Gemmatimonadota bacterium]|nr:lipoyl(octanoyl) transferase LipB [Gemmatimonadota bacterium]
MSLQKYSSESMELEVQRTGLISYGEALALQSDLVKRRRNGDSPDQLLLLEHPHVITMGTGTRGDHVLADRVERKRLGIDLVEVGRGGAVTYHGPGQLIGYPILDLKPSRKDVYRYLRDLEQVIIDALSALGVHGHRLKGQTGVWVSGCKIAAVGVRVSSSWITSHGFALNISTDLSYFKTIVPCGLQGVCVTSVSKEFGRHREVAEVIPMVINAFAALFERRVVSGSRTTGAEI